jgi:hypothetical protein
MAARKTIKKRNVKSPETIKMNLMSYQDLNWKMETRSRKGRRNFRPHAKEDPTRDIPKFQQDTTSKATCLAYGRLVRQ